jgi:hypothetical protein
MYAMVALLWLTATLFNGPWIWRESLVIWLLSIPKWPGTLALVFYDPWLLYVFIFWGISDLVLCFIIEAFLYELHGGTFVQFLVLSSLSGIHLVFAAAIFILRRRAVQDANKIILDDQQRYNKIWATECSRADAALAFLLLTDECNKLTGGCHKAVPRQFRPRCT